MPPMHTITFWSWFYGDYRKLVFYLTFFTLLRDMCEARRDARGFGMSEFSLPALNFLLDLITSHCLDLIEQNVDEFGTRQSSLNRRTNRK